VAAGVVGSKSVVVCCCERGGVCCCERVGVEGGVGVEEQRRAVAGRAEAEEMVGRGRGRGGW
jgi:hypothetical protein